MNPGPPQGQPLLNDHESQNLNSFFSGFDSNAFANAPDQLPRAQYGMPQGQFEIPPTFVGSETRMGVDPNHLQAGGYGIFDTNMMGQNMQAYNNSNTYNSNMPAVPYTNQYSPHFVDQLHSAASTVPGEYGHNWQHQPYANGMIPMSAPNPHLMRFGSDQHFQPTGYTASSGQANPDMNMPWLEPQHSSATNTAPNTRPNTEPSSPNWSKKRKHEEFQEQHLNGFMHNRTQSRNAHPSPPVSNPRRQRSSVVKHEHPAQTSQPPTPATNSKPETPLDEQPVVVNDDSGDDAEAEDEDPPPSATIERSPSPLAPWPASKARPPKSHKPPPPPKPSRKKKESRPKPKRPSHTPSSRTPLTPAQKKANHTNSEQRRRDATARSYAELYDLVPELDQMGKQSTMKKLEVVVEKVTRVKNGVKQLRAMLAESDHGAGAGGFVGGDTELAMMSGWHT